MESQRTSAERRCSHFRSREIIEKYQICQFAICLVNMLTYMLFIYFNRYPPAIPTSIHFFHAIHPQLVAGFPPCHQWICHCDSPKFLACQTYHRGVFERHRRKIADRKHVTLQDLVSTLTFKNCVRLANLSATNEWAKIRLKLCSLNLP